MSIGPGSFGVSGSFGASGGFGVSGSFGVSGGFGAQASAGSVRYQRGAFIAYEPEGFPGRRLVIPFRFNPESLTRSVTVEVGQKQPGTDGATTSGPAPGSQASAADPATGTIKETFSVTIRFDFADRASGLSGLDPSLGIAPEIAAVEGLMYPGETSRDRTSDGSEPVKAAKARPTVLFVWGRHRVLPVRISSLKIDETLYNATLHPIRAEIEASLEVLGDADAKNDAIVNAALEHTTTSRRELASLFYSSTAEQGMVPAAVPDSTGGIG